MHPNERLRAERIMRERQEREIKERQAHDAAIDAEEFNRGILSRVRPGAHDVASILNSPDETARCFTISVVPPMSGDAQRYHTYVNTRPTDLVITGPGESPPAEAIHSQSVAELRHEALQTRQRARAIAGGGLQKGIPIRTWGKEAH